tara:strand:+ start:106650 stop:106991 length:342 start_codon:yes stop_codon:yes gene_type:complete
MVVSRLFPLVKGSHAPPWNKLLISSAQLAAAGAVAPRLNRQKIVIKRMGRSRIQGLQQRFPETPNEPPCIILPNPKAVLQAISLVCIIPAATQAGLFVEHQRARQQSTIFSTR